MVLSRLGFSDFMDVSVIICFFTEPSFCCVFFYSASTILSSNLPGCIADEFSPVARQSILNFRKAKQTWDKARRRALSKSRLTSISFHYEETAGCSKPQHMEIHQRIWSSIVITAFFA